MKKLILALAVCLVFTACAGNESKQHDNTKEEQTQEVRDHVEILYFHGKQRCITCMAIEKYTKEAIETQLSDKANDETVVFRTIDISQPENETIAEKYEVTWSSLFISSWKNGKEEYENLTEFAFANARKNPDTFKSELIEKINNLLK